MPVDFHKPKNINRINYFINIRAKIYNSISKYYYMSAIRIYYIYVGYIYFFYLLIYGQIIYNILELRLFLYLKIL